MKNYEVAVRVSNDRFLIPLSQNLVKALGIKNGELFSQEIISDGILFRRMTESEDDQKDIGAQPPSKSPTPPHLSRGASYE